jgi:hypothetical protein
MSDCWTNKDLGTYANLNHPAMYTQRNFHDVLSDLGRTQDRNSPMVIIAMLPNPNSVL